MTLYRLTFTLIDDPTNKQKKPVRITMTRRYSANIWEVKSNSALALFNSFDDALDHIYSLFISPVGKRQKGK